MGKSKVLKPARRALSRGVLYIFAWLYCWVPFTVLNVFVSAILNTAYCFMRRNRKIAQESLEAAFGKELDGAQRELIARQCFMNIGRNASELFYAMARPQKISDLVEVNGQARLDAAMAKGKGVIAVTGHYGNFPLMMMHFAVSGLKTSCVIRPNRDEKLEEYLHNKRKDVSLGTIYARPRQACAVQAVKALHNGRLVFIMMDQDHDSGAGVFVEFFGRRASTATGPVVFANRTGAVILPMFIVRGQGHRHTIHIEEPYELSDRGSEEETLQYNMQQLTAKVEHYTRQYPTEWAWMHRRWKTQPEGRKVNV